MITQKPISLKIDVDLLHRLDERILNTSLKRNSVINDAVRMYLELNEAHDKERISNMSGQHACPEALAFIKKYLVHNVQFFLDKIDHH